MSRVKRSVHARKKRRATLERAKGYRGEKHSSYRRAKEQLLKSDTYAYRDRKQPQARIPLAVDHSASTRPPAGGHELQRSSCTACAWPRSSSTARSWPTSPSATPRRSDVLPSAPGRRRLPDQARPHRPMHPGRLEMRRPFSFRMITSKDNQQLKTIRQPSARARDGLFVAEGEDLVDAAAAARLGARAPAPRGRRRGAGAAAGSARSARVARGRRLPRALERAGRRGCPCTCTACTTRATWAR